MINPFQTQFDTFTQALMQRLGMSVGVSEMQYGQYTLEWKVQVGHQVFDVWCNNLDNPVSWGWKCVNMPHRYTNANWNFDFE